LGTDHECFYETPEFTGIFENQRGQAQIKGARLDMFWENVNRGNTSLARFTMARFTSLAAFTPSAVGGQKVETVQRISSMIGEVVKRAFSN
jgi:hypothetical protein